MAKSTGHPKPSKRKSDIPTSIRTSVSKLGRPLKTPLTNKGMAPKWLLDAAGTISVKTLNAMEKAIEEGCGQVDSHGE